MYYKTILFPDFVVIYLCKEESLKRLFLFFVTPV